MSDNYQYQTKRAEWFVGNSNQKNTFGPFVSEHQAERFMQLNSLHPKQGYSIRYQETVVDIDPILSGVVEKAAQRIETWMIHRMIQKKGKRRNPIFFHEKTVQQALDTLAREVRNLIKIEK